MYFYKFTKYNIVIGFIHYDIFLILIKSLLFLFNDGLFILKINKPKQRIPENFEVPLISYSLS